MNKKSNYIFGEYVTPLGSISSYVKQHNGELTKVKFLESEKKELDLALNKSKNNRKLWGSLDKTNRLSMFDSIIKTLEKNQDALIKYESECSGKSEDDAFNEINTGIEHWRMARSALECLYDNYYDNVYKGVSAYERHAPIGTVGLITPYNFPFVVLCERLPYLLAAGCSAVIKPSELTPESTLFVAELLTKSGLPDGVVDVLQGSGDQIGNEIVCHKLVNMVSFTGSTSVGRNINIICASNFKRVSLELGGNNPIIVDFDANLDNAVSGILKGFLYHSGQCCISTNRLYVHKDIKNKIINKILIRLKDIVNNNSFDEIILHKKYEQLKELYASFINNPNYKIHYSNKPDSEKLNQIIPPLFIEAIDKSSEDIELFGPFLILYSFEDLKTVVSYSNDTKYGLAASYWGNNIERIEFFLSNINAGRIWINDTLKSYPVLPLGGLKESGLGKEGGYSGINTYLTQKSVVYNFLA